MITIEIHGLNFPEAHKLRAKIFEEIADKKYASMVGIEIFTTDIIGINGNVKPKLCLATNCGQYADEILIFLQDFTFKNTSPKMSVGYIKLSDYNYYHAPKP